MLMSSEAESRANFPLRGKWCAAPKGVHFQRAAGAVVWFSLPPAALPPQAAYILIARRAIPPPSEPSEPFEPFEPSRHRRVHKKSVSSFYGIKEIPLPWSAGGFLFLTGHGALRSPFPYCCTELVF